MSAPAPDPLLRSTILMVDDEEANLDLLEAFLRPEGYENLIRATDPRDVESLMRAHPPDLILLDLHMPHRDGFDLLRDIRASLSPDDYLPVLVLTADATYATKTRALASGARDFLTKPLDALEVALRVRILLGTRASHRTQRLAREAAQAAERRAVLLAEASRVLASSFDCATTLSQLARTLVPALAETCLIAVAELDRSSVAAIADVEPTRERALRERFAESAAPLDRAGLGARLRAGVRATLGDAAAGWELQMSLDARSREIGSMLLLRDAESPAFDAADRMLVEELARRAALAVENAHLVVEAQHAMRARDQVLSVVAHDLRNPLAAIAMNAEMVRNLLPPETAPHPLRGLERIERAAQRTHALVEDLLHVSKLSHAAFAVRPEATPPAPLFAEALAMLQPLADARGVELTIHGDANAAPVLADAGRVLQVLSNLVGNALKFTPDGGSIRIEWRGQGDELLVTVEDDGPGIPLDRVPDLFGSLWQTDAGDRCAPGLGLMIARTIIEAHGGRIWVESHEGAGATFRFTLRFAPARGRVAAAAEAVRNGGES